MTRLTNAEIFRDFSGTNQRATVVYSEFLKLFQVLRNLLRPSQLKINFNSASQIFIFLHFCVFSRVFNCLKVFEIFQDFSSFFGDVLMRSPPSNFKALA